ncbi:hypothetical protein C8R47DRAFT_1206349 [Mycena vitilis]|nr:hypothetical protein C8R47DRAFT_1206349 [Mycena vitilis]
MDSVFSWPYRRLHFGSHLLGTPKLSPKCLKYNRCDVGSCRSWTGTGMIRVSQTGSTRLAVGWNVEFVLKLADYTLVLQPSRSPTRDYHSRLVATLSSSGVGLTRMWGSVVSVLHLESLS